MKIYVLMMGLFAVNYSVIAQPIVGDTFTQTYSNYLANENSFAALIPTDISNESQSIRYQTKSRLNPIKEENNIIITPKILPSIPLKPLHTNTQYIKLKPFTNKRESKINNIISCIKAEILFAHVEGFQHIDIKALLPQREEEPYDIITLTQAEVPSLHYQPNTELWCLIPQQFFIPKN